MIILSLILFSLLFKIIGFSVVKMLFNCKGVNKWLLEAQYLFTGFIFLTTIYAIIKTSGNSSLLIILLSIIAFFFLKRRRFKLHFPPLDLKEWVCFGVYLGLSFYFFAIYATLSGVEVAGYEFWLSGDTLHYAKLASKFNEYGKESLTLIAGNNSFVVPYHYLDIWAGALMSNFSKSSTIDIISLVLYPLLISILSMSLIGIIKENFSKISLFGSIIIVLFGFSVTYSSLFNFLFQPFLNSLDNHYLIAIIFNNNGKWFAVAPAIVFALNSFDKKQFLETAFYFNIIIVGYNVLFIGAFPFIIFLLVYTFFRSKKDAFNIFILLSINTGFIYFFWSYFQNIDLFKVDERIWYKTISLLERFIKEAFLSILMLVIFYFQSKRKMYFYGVIIWGSFLIWILLNGVRDSWQFFHGWNLILTSTFFILIVAWFYQYLLKGNKLLSSVLILVLFFFHFIHARYIYQFQVESNEKRYSKLFTNEINQKILSVANEEDELFKVLYLSTDPFLSRWASGPSPMKFLNVSENFDYIYHATFRSDSLISKYSSPAVVPLNENINFSSDYVKNLAMKDFKFILTKGLISQHAANIIELDYNVLFKNDKNGFSLYIKK